MKRILIAGYLKNEAQQVQEEIYEMLKPCAFSLAMTYDEYLSLIQEFQPDIIISDYKSPDFDGFAALKIAAECLPDTSFIFLTDINNVETAVECLKNGADDFILKENLNRLPLTVLKVIEQKQIQLSEKSERRCLLKDMERYRQMAELSPLPISIIDPDGRYLYLNPIFMEIFGYTLEDIPTGKEWFRRAFPDDEQRDIALSTWLSDLGKSIIYQKRPRIFNVKCKNGTYRDVLFMPITIKGGEQVVIYEDVTERKLAVEMLQKSEENLKRQNQLMTSLILKGDWFYEDLIANIRRILEISSELIQTERVSVWRYNEDYSEIVCIGLYEKSTNSHSEGEELVAADFPTYTASHINGKVVAAVDVFTDHRTSQIPSIYFKRHGITSLLDAPVYVGGRLAGLLSFEHVGEKRNWSSSDERLSLSMATHVSLCFEIDERNRAEEVLRQTEEKYRSIFENAAEGIFQTTAEGQFITANPALARMYGCNSTEEFIANVTDISRQLYYDPQRRKEFLEVIKKEGFVHNFEIKSRRKDGGIFWVSLNAKAVRDDSGKIRFFEGMVEDITERKKLGEQLRQSQKMEAVGTLAGGVAHDFNNILTVIMGYAHLMLMKLKDDDLLHPYLNQIITAANKATSLTSSLLAFSRKQMISLSPINLNDSIQNIEKMLLRIIGEDIELMTFLSEDDLIIMADTGQIEQILLNLATNARDAMPDGGLLIIETEKIQIDEKQAKGYGYSKPGAYALLTFTDFGMGMDKATAEKIFEPFFTTKEVGKGTGLGLSMIYGIVKQHNGYINCYSEQGKCTTFKIYFPLTHEKAIPAKPPISIDSIIGTEMILVAEDDANVRKLTKYVLERYGYKVIEAVDGWDAVEKFKENQGNIDLLLFDVIMPRMNGKMAYEEIKKLRPEIPAIFISGYTADVIHKKGILEEGLTIVFKPITPMGILSKIRQVLSHKKCN